jgi:hypothetical protein
MATAFDPYVQWLGIERDGLHPNRYELLGLAEFESDPSRIEESARRQTQKLAVHLSGEHAALAKRVTDEVENARVCLLDAAKKTPYDMILRRQLEQQGKLPQPAAAASPPAPPETDIDSLLPPMAGPPAAAQPVLSPPPPPPGVPPAYAAPGYPPTGIPAPAPGYAPYPPAPAYAPAVPMAVAVPAAPPAMPTAVPVGGYPPAANGYPPPAPWGAPPPAYDPYAAAPAPYGAPYAPPAAVAVPYAPPPADAPFGFGNEAPLAAPAPAMVATVEPALEAPPAPAAESQPAVALALPAPRREKAGKSLAPLMFAVLLPILVVGIVGGIAVLNKQRNKSGRPRDGERVAANGGSSERQPITPTPTDGDDAPPDDAEGDEPQDDVPATVPHPEDSDDETPSIPEEDDPDEPTESMPDDVPAPDEPDPDEPSMPDESDDPEPDEPDPDEPTMPDEPEAMPADVDVPQALSAVRYALAHKNLTLARGQLDAALSAVPEGDLATEVARIELIYGFVEQFWKAVDESISAIAEATDFPFGEDDRASMVEKSPEMIILRIRGQNHEFALDNLPPKVAVALAENYFAKDDPVTKLCIASYLAVHPDADREQARGILLQASLTGQEEQAEQLMPELDVEPPTELPAIAGGGGGDASGRLPVPSRPAQDQAREEIRGAYQTDYDQAVGPPELVALSDVLLNAGVDTTDDATKRYVLLAEAAMLAARAGDLDALARAADQMSGLYQIEAWDAKVDALQDAGQGTDDQALQAAIATAALTLYDDAAIEEQYDAAKKLARAALAAARKAKDQELLKDASARNKEAASLK